MCDRCKLLPMQAAQYQPQDRPQVPRTFSIDLALKNPLRGAVCKLKEIDMWTSPAATEMRFGFEVTMYVCNRQRELRNE